MITTGLLESPRAGRKADRRYKELRGKWRREVWWKLALASWPFIAIGFMGGVVPLDDYWKWFAGLLGGAGVAMWIAFWDMPPSYIETWRSGALGEQQTEKALRPLENEGWRVKHDLRKGKYNDDHLIVGPGGVFLLDSKNYDGLVVVDQDDLRVTTPHGDGAGWTDSKRGSRIRGAAASRNRHLQRATGISPWVQGVVVVWAEVEGGVVEGNKFVVVQGDKLVDWLRTRPNRLSQERIDRIAHEMRAT